MKKTSKIPTFKNYEEEAQFWDTHSVVDYLDELKLVKVKFAKNLSQDIIIPFDAKTLTLLRKKADMKGVEPTALAHTWIMDRLFASA